MLGYVSCTILFFVFVIYKPVQPLHYGIVIGSVAGVNQCRIDNITHIITPAASLYTCQTVQVRAIVGQAECEVA